MRTSNSIPVQFIGQGPLPEFDYSQEPLPDNLRVLLWMLDGAERRHRLARRWQSQAAPGLHVEVEGGDIMVTLPGITPRPTISWRTPLSFMADTCRTRSIDGLRSRRRRSSEKPGSSQTTRLASWVGLSKAPTEPDALCGSFVRC